MKFKITTAYHKISNALTQGTRVVGVQGGQGAGKTVAILRILIHIASTLPNEEIIVCSAELSKMRLTVIKDFLSLFKGVGGFQRNRWKNGTEYYFENGSYIKFIGLDKEDIGKGLRCDWLFINEANKVYFETYREIASRADRIILDFNPNESFWYHREVMNRECTHLVLTFRDNECISPTEESEIMSYYDRGYDIQGNIINSYWANKWLVYGKGEVGTVDGRIFMFEECTYNDFIKFDGVQLYGVDWGTVDPWAIISVKYKDGVIKFHQLNYQSENEIRARMSMAEINAIKAAGDEGLVTWMFKRLAIPKHALIVCDNNRKEKIIQLRKTGWENAVEAPKKSGSILDGIDIMQMLKIYHTDLSHEAREEQQNYAWAQDRHGTRLEKPIDLYNHIIDALRYDILYLVQEGYIKAV